MNTLFCQSFLKAYFWLSPVAPINVPVCTYSYIFSLNFIHLLDFLIFNCFKLQELNQQGPMSVTSSSSHCTNNKPSESRSSSPTNVLDVNPLIYLSSFNESVIPMTTEEAMAQFEHYLGQCFLTWTFLANLEIEHTGMQWRIRTGPKICFY